MGFKVILRRTSLTLDPLSLIRLYSMVSDRMHFPGTETQIGAVLLIISGPKHMQLKLLRRKRNVALENVWKGKSPRNKKILEPVRRHKMHMALSHCKLGILAELFYLYIGSVSSRPTCVTKEHLQKEGYSEATVMS